MHVQTGSSAVRTTGKRLSCRRGQPPTLKAISFLRFRSSRLQAGYSLIEVVIAAAIIVLVYGTIINCYIQSGLRAQWTGYSLAAQSLALQQIEQARSAMWDPSLGSGAINQITQLNLSMRTFTSTSTSQTWSGYTTGILDVPYATTNFITVTNYVQIQLINLNNDINPPIPVHIVRVDTVWPFYYRRGTNYFTNTSATMIAPDNHSL